MADITHMIRVGAPIDRVDALVGTAEGFTKWWAEDVITASDGTVSLGFFSRQTEYILRRLPSRPNQVVWRCESGREWEGTDIRFNLEQDKSVTVLRFAHANWRGVTDYFTSCNTTWGELMFRIARDAEGHGHGPLFKRDSLAY